MKIYRRGLCLAVFWLAPWPMVAHAFPEATGTQQAREDIPLGHPYNLTAIAAHGSDKDRSTPAGQPFLLRKVVLLDNLSIPERRFRPHWRSKLGKLVTVDELDDLASRLTQVYTANGRALSKVTVFSFNPDDGTLILRAVEGRIVRMDFSFPNGFPHVDSLEAAWRMLLTTPAPKQALLDKALRQLQAWPGYSARVEWLNETSEGDHALKVQISTSQGESPEQAASPPEPMPPD